MYRNFIILLIFVLYFSIFNPCCASSDGQHKVLILHSYRHGYIWTDNIMEGIRDEFDQNDPDADLVVQYMDSKKKPPEVLFPILEELYKLKYSEDRFDVIIASDDAAFRFLLDRRDTLFPGVPVILCGIDANREKLTGGIKGFTGVTEFTDFEGTLKLVLRLQPNTKNIVAICDDTETGSNNLTRARRFASIYREELNFIELTNLSAAELFKNLQSLLKNSVIIDPAFHRDREGKTYSGVEMYRLFKENCDLPIYSLWDVYVGKGAVGGVVTSGFRQGQKAAQMALRVLQGESVDAIPVQQQSPNVNMFNYEKLKRFHIPLSNLPEDRVVINEPFSFYHTYKRLIWGTAFFLLAQALTILALVVNIVRRKRAEKELRENEEKLRQSQKMEAIGQLAGGVAHDFNNLLMVINGYSEYIYNRIDPSQDDIRQNALEIKKAGKRAASLTRQLLAFSRKQVLKPMLMNLNDSILNTEKMLRRLIGENIELTTIPDLELGLVKADPGQIEQIILNLAVNARDAMPDGGKLILETKNVILDKDYARRHVSVDPGLYVMLAVSDTGCGMDRKTQEKVFDPFFTTKEQGKGTGLGLSTVYGIVKQSGGNIWVYSEPGKGTTFKIYLPRAMDAAKPAMEMPSPLPALNCPETILVVEDDDMVRRLTARILRVFGYKVFEANSGSEALRLIEEYKAPFHLLLTDIVMPQMSGRELAEKLQADYPGLKTLYMSGYTDNAIVHHGILDKGVNFIQKPVNPEDLARKVREILDVSSVKPS